MPNVPAQTTLYDVVDCMVFPLLTDLPSNPSPTYGTGIDVPGISAISLDPSIVSAALKGDGKKLRTKSRIDSFQVKGTYGFLDFNVLKVMLGGAITTQSSSFVDYDYVLSGGSASLPDFGIIFQVADTDDDLGVGDLHLMSYKCKITGGTILGQSSDSFGEPTFEMDVNGPNANNGAFRAVRARLHAADTALALM